MSSRWNGILYCWIAMLLMDWDMVLCDMTCVAFRLQCTQWNRKSLSRCKTNHIGTVGSYCIFPVSICKVISAAVGIVGFCR